MLVEKSITFNSHTASVWRLLTERMHKWPMDKEIAIETNWQAGSPIAYDFIINLLVCNSLKWLILLDIKYLPRA